MPRIIRIETEERMSMWNYYIGVDDIDRAASEIAVEGGKIVFGPMETPGCELSLVGIDRQGAVFGLDGPKRG